MWWQILKFYGIIYFLVKKYLKRNIKGIGFIASKIKNDKIFKFHNSKFYFNPSTAKSYGLLISGIPNENETHIFFNRLLKNLDFNIDLIDVGASIGEFAITLAKHNKVNRVYAFEPNKFAYNTLMVGKFINNLENLYIINKIVSNEIKNVKFNLSINSPTASSIYDRNLRNTDAIDMFTTTVDIELDINLKNEYILLIDVEGYEPEVLKGATELINKKCPLIIFEYNYISQRHFNLNDISNIIGTEYKFYRLRQEDGLLDLNFNSTWNVVAINRDSAFTTIIDKMIKTI